MSIPGRNSTAAMLVRTGFVVVLVLAKVPGFRPVLARSWHDQLGRLRVGWQRAALMQLNSMMMPSRVTVNSRRSPSDQARTGTAWSNWRRASLGYEPYGTRSFTQVPRTGQDCRRSSCGGTVAALGCCTWVLASCSQSHAAEGNSTTDLASDVHHCPPGFRSMLFLCLRLNSHRQVAHRRSLTGDRSRAQPIWTGTLSFTELPMKRVSGLLMTNRMSSTVCGLGAFSLLPSSARQRHSSQGQDLRLFTGMPLSMCWLLPRQRFQCC